MTFEEWKPLVYCVYREHFRPSEHRDDLISEGFLALLDAMRGYDWTKGPFKTYAYACIRNRMARYLAAPKFSELQCHPACRDHAKDIEQLDFQRHCVEKLRKCMPKQELALLERRACGSSLQKIANEMGCSLEWARRKLNQLTGEARAILA